MPDGWNRHWARGLRDGLGLTRQELAEKIDCSAEAVKGWESGRSEAPRTKTLLRLAGALGVQLEKELLSPPEKDTTTQVYIAGVLHHARPLTDAELAGTARVLRKGAG